MNDQELAEAIDETLESYYRGQLTPFEAIARMSRIKGEHDMWKAGQQQC